MSDQNELLLQALRTGPLTALEILDKLGIARASARVYDLRQAGHDVRSQMITVRNRRGEPCRVALYSLHSAQGQLLPIAPGRGAMAA